MLARLNDDIEYSEEETENLSWQEKTKLVQKDPVTCSRYFDHRVQEFMNTVLKSSCEPIGKVKAFFYRVEFQQRGSSYPYARLDRKCSKFRKKFKRGN